MKKPLWKFTDDKGTFVSENADQINTLYFPLCNSHPFMSSITPTLHGDIKTSNNTFLLEPVSRIDLSNSKASRNFWIYVNPKKIWSAAGVSKDLNTIKNDKFKLEAGFLWQKITRENKQIGLKAEITSFVPATGEPVEIMLVALTNISGKTIKFIPTAAIPIYARSSNNLRDHRHVTSLLNRIEPDKFGLVVTPTLLFDETGHKKNRTSYFILGIDEKKFSPEYIYSTQEEFCGDNSDLEAPTAVLDNRLPDKKYPIQGKEAIGALRFKTKTLKPKETYSYIILAGIVNDKPQVKSLFNNFNTLAKVRASLAATQGFWQKKAGLIMIDTGNHNFDNWFRWVNIQPVLRKIFGCSFLPDFDYGKGGRGWRDLWQDCLSLILTNPQQTRPLVINNFKGVRIDGTNATIIGPQPGEFIADRNNITRVWMDHGIWPWFTTLFYLHQSADFKILLEEIPYFYDQQTCRGREKDYRWAERRLTYKGSVLEHILVENLVQFFNVGPHNHIRLENADWNDGMDMADKFGESVAFSAMYAGNLKSLAAALEKLKLKNIAVFKELGMLLDTLSKNPLDYSKTEEKNKILDKYFSATKYGINGKKITVSYPALIKDLNKKADWMIKHIRENEWLPEGFFNGYYDQNKEKVEGKINGILRMGLTGQAFPIMAGIATENQMNTIFKNAKKNLQDKNLGGFRLNTDFKTEQPNLGRAFSFIYGDKENGAFFNQMSVMFAYALYNQGQIRKGYEVFNSIYQMAIKAADSKVYPCLPEYFNAQGRGMYSYLTGSASWFIFTLLTQVFGVRGEYGDLIIEPKLTKGQFKNKKILSLTTTFADKSIEIRFVNPHQKDFGSYAITGVSLNRKTLAQNIKAPAFSLSRKDFCRIARQQLNIIEVMLD